MNRVAYRFVYLAAIAAASTAAAQQLPLQVYTTADGLAHNHINCIRQDSRGFLWFCTDEGLTRFDGYRLSSYTAREGLPHPWINDLIETRDGGLWVASDGGVSRLNLRRSSAAEPLFTTYVPNQQPDARRVNALAEDAAGSIWCATYNGLYRLDRAAGGVEFHPVEIGLPAGVVEGRLLNSVAVDRDGTLWLGGRTGLYRRWPDGRARRYTVDDGLPADFTASLLRDRAGGWWVATRDAGFCRFNPEPGRAGHLIQRCYSTADGLPHNDVRSILQASDGTMWVGTLGGLSEFDPAAEGGAVFRNYDARNGLSQSQIYKIFEDRDGNLWIGTQRGGVMRMAPGGFVSYRETDGFLSGTTHHQIFESTAGDLCVLTGTGSGALMQRLNGHRFVAAAINLPRAHNRSVFVENGLQDHTGEWWLATRDGLVHFPRGSVEQLARLAPRVFATADGFPSGFIDQVYEDARGTIWVVTTHAAGAGEFQLRVWDRALGRLRLYAAAATGVWDAKSGTAVVGEDAAGGLWLGFRDCLVRSRAGRLERFFDGARGIQGPVSALHLDHSGRLWVACVQGGLYRVGDPGSAHPRLDRYSTAQGLSSNEILCLTEDRSGRIYAGTNRGVDRLDPVSGAVKHFTASDGLPKGAVVLAYRDHNGMLWFASDQEISRLAPAPDRFPAASPEILITGLRSMGVPRQLSPLGESRVGYLEITPGRDQLQIDFLGIDLRPGAMLQYQYKLEGAGTDWNSPTAERTVNYAGIAPGSYRFLVRAVSGDGTVSPTPAVVEFKVLAPVWRRWWFLSMAAAIAALVIYAGHRMRVRRLLAMEGVRMRIATDLHDDIGASLSHIAVLSELARKEAGQLGLGGDAQRLYAPLTRIGSVSREVIDSMGDIVWAISPRKDRVSNLTQRMREFAGEILGSKGIEFHLHAEGLDQERKLDPEVRRQVFLVFKECINNIVRHAGSTVVWCDLAMQRKQLVLSVRDAGRGFAAAASAVKSERGAAALAAGENGHGLLSMRRRAAALGGAIEFAAEPDRGVTVVLRVPIT